MEPLSWELYRRGRDTSAYDYGQAVVAMQAYARQLVSELAPYDAFLTPSLAERPVRIGEIDSDAGHGGVLALGPLHPLHRGGQRDRPAGDLAACLPGRRRPAHRRST